MSGCRLHSSSSAKQLYSLYHQRLAPDHSMDVDQWSRVWRSRRTVLQMLRDRGYVIDEDDIETDFDTFQGMFFEPRQVNGIYDHITEAMPRIKTKFDVSSGRLKKDDIKDIQQEAAREGITRMILVVRGNATNELLRKHIMNFRTVYNLHVEAFHEKELLVNVTEHELVPKHEVLSPEQKEELLSHYHIDENKLPRIFVTDVVVRYFGCDAGTVLKITRRSETAGRYVTYRLVYEH